MPENLPALRGASPQDILARYLSQETTAQIAQSYGVTRQALGQFLIKHAESDWKNAQVARAISRKESAEDDLESIARRIETADKEQRDKLALSLAGARERLRAAQWDLERVCRRIYGQDVPAVAAAVQVNINLRRNQDTDTAQVIDAEVKTTD